MKRKISEKFDNVLIRMVGILFIGIIMPIIFYRGSDSKDLFYWIIVSVFITFIEWEISRRMILNLWVRFPWESKPAVHLLMNVLFLILLILFASTIVYVINYIFDTVPQPYLKEMSGVHVAIVLVTFFTTSVYEATYLFYKWKKTLIRSALLEKENIQSQYEALKNQVNPHFLFNSLNVLASIISENPEKAVLFINRFSSIYRYVLDIKDLTSIELHDELEFVESYVYLQKLRYGDNLQVEIEVNADSLNSCIMPLSVQVLMENAIKHNEISDVQPLKIKITSSKGYIIVENNLQSISHKLDSPGIGLINLKERYKLVTDKVPYFYKSEDLFIAGIPLLIEN